MKSIIRVLALALLLSPLAGMAQTKTAPWPELKQFHHFMSTSFHPAEEGNLSPLRKQADSMLIVAKAWQASSIPSNYKPEETKETLDKLVKQCTEISAAAKLKDNDKKLTAMITDAHDTFHKIVGECKKTEEH